MALPSESEIQAIIGAVVDELEETRLFAESNSPNFLGLEDTLLALYEHELGAGFVNAQKSMRGSLSSMVSTGQARSLLDPCIRLYGRVLGFPDRDPLRVLYEIRRDFVTNSKTVNSREFTYGAASAGGSNVGDGTVLRLTEDEDGHDLEAATPEVKTVRCVQDEHSGAAEHNEIFEMRGAPPGSDYLSLPGSGRVARVKALSTLDSEAFIDNPSFSRFTGTAGSSPTAVSGWSVTTAWSNTTIVSSAYYRDHRGETTPYALRFDANEKITQNLNNRGVQVEPSRPVYIQIAVLRESTADGTLTLRFGASSVAVDVTTLSDGSWEVVKVATPDGWFKTWNEEDPTVEIELASNTTGTVTVDDVVIGSMALFDGTWYAIVGGATPFLRDDVFTITDTALDVATIQRWLWRTYGRYLPHTTGGTETWSDP